MGGTLWIITRWVLVVVGALTLYVLVAAILWNWALRRLRRPANGYLPGDVAEEPRPRERRAGAWGGVPDWVRRDREWAAAVVLLGAPAIADRTAPFVDFQARRIDWLGLRLAASTWGHRLYMLVETAYDLAQGQHQPADQAVPHTPVSVIDLIDGIADPDFELLQAAVGIRRGAYPPGAAVRTAGAPPPVLQ